MDREVCNSAPENFSYKAAGFGSTMFSKLNNMVFLKSLFGMSCGLAGDNAGTSRVRGLVYLRTDSGIYDSTNLMLIKHTFNKNSISLAWKSMDGHMRLESSWSFCAITGVISRKDRLMNIGSENISVLGYMARFAFSPGSYELYSQRGIWCSENQGIWQNLHHGSMELSCEGARTCQGSTPYLCIRSHEDEPGVVFHVLPVGNWIIRVSAHTGPGDSHPYAVVEMGQSDKNLKMKINTGESFELPEILIHGLPGGSIEAGAPVFQKYLLKNKFQDSKKTAPVVYNSWFDDFEFLDVDRLRRQLETAKSIGCEVFTIDAGWYGAGEGDWFTQAGDWREKQNAAFKGGMFDFAEEVRSFGLGFGLWMEPERFGTQVPVVKEHPDWFVYNGSGYYYPDLKNQEAYNYILHEIVKLVECYKLVWLKIDFNFEPAIDPRGEEFYSYYHLWYRIMDELRSKYPGLFVEGCASGGMRLDINTLSHNDAHFMSDSVNPVDSLRIYQGALLRLPGGRLTKWAVLRSAGNGIPGYGIPVDEAPVTLVTPGGAVWDTSTTVSADFASTAALTGIFGLGGDISSLPKEDLECLERHITFFKKWREFIISSVSHMLTPVRPKEDRSGWVAFQLQDIAKSGNLLFVYRLEDTQEKRAFRLKELDKNKRYEIRYQNRTGIDSFILSGEQLEDEGVWVVLPKRYSAAVISIMLYKS